jgi:hypothetical protein
MRQMASDPAPAFVVSLLLSDSASHDDVVLGVRRRTIQAPRHPGVVSTPTQRIPRPLFDACVGAWPPPTGPRPTIVPVEAGAPYPIGAPCTSELAVSYVVESLLARKLEMAAPLAAGLVRGTAAPVALASAIVPDRQGQGPPEPTVMLTIRVLAGGVTRHLPPATVFYSQLLLCDATRFTEAVRRRDALAVHDSLDPFEVCIGGLCVVSASAVLRAAYDATEYADGPAG